MAVTISAGVRSDLWRHTVFGEDGGHESRQEGLHQVFRPVLTRILTAPKEAIEKDSRTETILLICRCSKLSPPKPNQRRVT